MKWTTQQRKISDLVPYPHNPRSMTEKQRSDLEKSLRKFDLAEIPAINTDNTILAGHMRLRILADLGRGGEMIDVRVPDRELTEKEVQEYNIRSNKNTGSWDMDILANDFDMPDLKEWGWDDADFGMPDGSADMASGQDADPQEATDELAKKYGVEVGQIWKMGTHLIACGDCTDSALVIKLMDGKRATVCFTDPPYGVSIGAKNRMLNSFQPSGRNLTDISADDMSCEDLRSMLLNAFMLAKKEALSDECAVFVCSPQGGSLGLMMMMMMRDSGLEIRHVLNWVKNAPTFSMGRLDYDYQHEPILFTWTKTHKRKRDGEHQTSVWTVDKPRSSKSHPTMKPVELPVNAILNHSDKGDIVYEPFSGSGTTIIASEQTGRVCRALELSPQYVAVAIDRWEQATGEKAEVVTP